MICMTKLANLDRCKPDAASLWALCPWDSLAMNRARPSRRRPKVIAFTDARPFNPQASQTCRGISWLR